MEIYRIYRNRSMVGNQQRAHIIWNEHNPNNPWKKGMVVHHKDEDTLNDAIENLELMTHADHQSLHHKGKIISKETKHKISESVKGEKNHFYGKHFSEESKQKLSLSKKGQKHSEETLRKMSVALKGKQIGPSNGMFGKHHSEETRRKYSLDRMGNKYNLGNKASEETKLKMSLAQKKRWSKNK